MAELRSVRGLPGRALAASFGGLGALALLLALAIAAGAVGGAGSASANQFRRCSPVVDKAPSGGFDRAVVLVVAGKVDCEKSRRAIFSALSAKAYKGRGIGSWTCSTTTRADSGHLYGATCTREQYEREVVRSTVPKPCPGCHSKRD